MQKEENQKSLIKIIAGLAIGFFLIFLVFKIFQPNPATISGSIKYNGVKPDDPSQGKVVVEQREIGETQYEIAVDNLPLEDNASWAWKEAEEGKTYQLRAYVQYQGKRVSESSTTTATAPANGQNLTFNVTAEDIPSSGGDTSTSTVTISGTLNLNGYVPSGSFVNILSREGSSGDFQTLSQGIPAVDGRKLTWSTAKAGVYYTFRGQLFDVNGNPIGTSEDVSIVGPASSQILTIDSIAQAPAEKTSITGQVILNGPTQPNSTILLLQRKPGDKNYTAFDRIAANSGAQWSFDDAVSGQAYEISASLQVNEQDTSVGNVLRVTAPAENETITINTNYSLTPPTQTPTASCGNQQEGRWNVSVTFPAIQNAAQYFMQIGTSQGSRDTFQERTNATGGSVTRNILIDQDKDYYAAYAYTFDSSCSSQQCFSGSSPTLIFKCPQ